MKWCLAVCLVILSGCSSDSVHGNREYVISHAIDDPYVIDDNSLEEDEEEEFFID